MKRRGPSLGKTYKKLPGFSVQIDGPKCSNCQTCVETCFVSAVETHGNIAIIGDDCRGCGICISYCPEGAISLTMENEEVMFKQLLDRVREISNLPLKIDN